MSLLLKEGALVRDMWPASLPRISKDKTLEQLKPHEKVPDDFDDLLMWAHVRHFPTRPGAPYSLLYSGSALNTDAEVHEVQFRVQGYVVELNIEPLGDWNNSEGDAARAKQFLTLHGGDDRVPFEAQVETLAHIRKLVLRQTRSAKENTPQNGRIHLHNNVFRKVRPGMPKVGVLQAMDDPFDRARALARRWLVLHKIAIGYQDADGKLKLASHYSIKPGDFVDVKVRVDISSYQQGMDKETRVYFSMERIVRLSTAAEVAMSGAVKGRVKEPRVVQDEDLTWDEVTGNTSDFMSIG